MMITVRYSCTKCGLVDQKAFVRERRLDEEIITWMFEVRCAVTDAHVLATPQGCNSEKFDLKLPLSQSGQIGIN